MTQPEARISQRIQTTLRGAGFFCFKVHGSEHMMAGLPDIIVCAEGLFIGLETKTPDKRGNTSARQEFVHTQIRLAGGCAQVVCGPTEALRVVRETIAKFRDHP
jgi:hypothetical protein